MIRNLLIALATILILMLCPRSPLRLRLVIRCRTCYRHDYIDVYPEPKPTYAAMIAMAIAR